LKKSELKLLTYNVGLARAVLFGRSYEPMPHVEARSRCLPQTLMSLNADIVALQEIYEHGHRSQLAQALADLYPFTSTFDIQSLLGVNDGLMLLSKFPIADPEFVAFKASLIDDSLFTRKGFTRCRIDTPLGEITAFNVYTAAGGLFRHPERPNIDAVRQLQLDQLTESCGTAGGSHLILLGDFNTGPQVSPSNYASLLHRGFVDTYAVTDHADGEPEVTWDPRNPLNVDSPHRMCPPQRIDHVMLHERSLKKLHIKSSRIVAHEHTIPIPTGQNVTPSDHYGLLTILEG